MRERDSGRLDLDKPIQTYVPWFNIREAANSDGPVTARGLLTHSAGLPREADTPYWSDVRFPDLATVKARVSQQQNLYRPQDWFQYSNLGMTLLGEAVQASSGEKYADYVQRHILTPLGLSRTTTELPNRLHGSEFAVGYSARRLGWSRQPIAPYTVNAIAPAAGFASTAEDLARFASWQFRLLGRGGAEVLKASTLREMQRVHWVFPEDANQFWGLGFIVNKAGDNWLVGHDGYCPGYRSSLNMQPKDKIAVVVLSNVDDVDSSELGRQLLKLVGPDLAKAAKPPEPSKPAATAPQVDLAQFEGRYLRTRSESDTYVAPYGDELMAISLFNPDPSGSLVRLKPLGGERFVRLRKDGSEAEERRFERRPDGTMVYWVHSNYLEREPATSR
jgi:CubicO group peptidase (beta-lactamase class C family)